MALLVPAAAAQAATKTVDMGVPGPSGKAFEAVGATANAFFPSTVTVAVGDKVRFRPAGFHNLDIPVKGGAPQPLITPTGTKVAGAVDVAGAPLWFNGQDQLGFNPGLVVSKFGKTFAYTGKKAVNSGLPFANRPKPVTVRFAKAGTYTYFCDVHPGMKGTVKVVAKGSSVPSAKADKARVKKQVAAALKVAKGLPSTSVPAGTVDVGLAGKGGVEVYAFAPAKQTVPVGTTLSFRMSPGSYEAHTATAGPGNIEDPTSFIGTLAKAFEKPVLDPAAAVYPSDVPGTLVGLSPTLHGNGFWNSGALDNAPASPLPASNSVRFDAPGTYDFYCLIHPFMHGSVTVQ